MTRTAHPYHMHDAIYAQPGALRLVARHSAEALAAVVDRLGAMERIVLSGIGTSFHAALVGELLLAHAGRRGHRVRAFHSFELARYWPALEPGTGLVVVSHRGAPRHAREALDAVARQGGVAVAITGKGGEAAGGAGHVLHTVDQEQSSAHTVSYTCALALLATLAARIGGDDALEHELHDVPDQVALLLGQESWEEVAGRFGDRRRYWVVGGGPNTATAYEGALKLAEAAGADAVGFECEQFLHGPWAAMEAADLLVVIAPPGPARERCLAAARVAKDIGTPVIALVDEDDREIGTLAAETIALPRVPELLSPIVAAVPLQLLAYHLAVRRGANPDGLRGEQPAYARARAAAEAS
jgi:glucosamine--fructose-6-phosphate aminotransferase (isomerizing)